MDEPKLEGDTTINLNPKWIDWYCRKYNVPVWKAKKAGKERLRNKTK